MTKRIYSQRRARSVSRPRQLATLAVCWMCGSWSFWAAPSLVHATGSAPPDTTPPKIAFDNRSPLEGEWVGGNIHVGFQASDELGLDSVTIGICGNLNRFATPANGKRTLQSWHAFDLRQLLSVPEDGSCEIYAVARDLAGNSTKVNVHVHVHLARQDQSSPQLTYFRAGPVLWDGSVKTGPSAVSGTLGLEASASELQPGDSGVTRTEFWNSSELVGVVLSNPSPGNWNVWPSSGLDTTRYRNGTYLNLWVNAIDLAGNAGGSGPSATFLLRVANPLPSLPSTCRSVGTLFTCSNTFTTAITWGPLGLSGWGLQTLTGSGAVRSTLSWQPSTFEWTDATSQTKVNRYGLYSDPAAPLRLTWTPPRLLPPGTFGSVTIGAIISDLTTGCGSGASLSIGSLQQPTTRQMLTIQPNAGGLGRYVVPLPAGDQVVVDVTEGQVPCDAMRDAINLRYTAINQPPTLTPLRGPMDANLNDVPHPTVPIKPGQTSLLLKFEMFADDLEDGPSRLAYACTDNGVAFPCQVSGQIGGTGSKMVQGTFPSGPHTFQVTATDTGGLSTSYTWPQFVVQVVCGNGVVESGEQCDLGADNGQSGSRCSATCQWNPPLPDKHLDCTWYGEDGSLAPDTKTLPTTGGRREIFDLRPFQAGKAMSWTGDPFQGRHIGARCVATFTMPAAGHVLLTRGTAADADRTHHSDLSVQLDDFVWAPASFASNKFTSRVKPYALAAGSHRLTLEYHYYQPTPPAAPMWFYASYLPVPQDQWVGVKIDQQDRNVYREPQVVEPPAGEALSVDWGSPSPSPIFNAYFAGNFNFTTPNGRYVFDGDADDVLILHDVEQDPTQPTEFDHGWFVNRLFSLRGAVGGFAWDSPVARRTLYGLFGNQADNASVHVRWHFEPAAPTTPACGNGQVQPELGEQCDPPMAGVCDAQCHTITPNPTSHCNNNQICETGETVQSCPNDCGDTPQTHTINQVQNFGDLTRVGPDGQPDPFIVCRAGNACVYVADGEDPPGTTRVVIREEDSSSDVTNPIAAQTPVFLDDPAHQSPITGPNTGDLDYVQEVIPGVHEVSVQPPTGITAFYSVSIGGRNHTSDTFVRGTRVQFFVPPGSFASVNWLYLESDKVFSTSIDGGELLDGGGGGGGAAAARAMDDTIGRTKMATFTVAGNVLAPTGIRAPRRRLARRAVSFADEMRRSARAAATSSSGGTFKGTMLGDLSVSRSILDVTVDQILLKRWPKARYICAPGIDNPNDSLARSCLSSTPVLPQYAAGVTCSSCVDLHPYNECDDIQQRFGLNGMRVAGMTDEVQYGNILGQYPGQAGFPWVDYNWCYSGGAPGIPQSQPDRLESTIARAARQAGIPYHPQDQDGIVSGGNTLTRGQISRRGNQYVYTAGSMPAALQDGATPVPAFLVKRDTVYSMALGIADPPPYVVARILTDARMQSVVNKKVIQVVDGSILNSLVSFRDLSKDPNDVAANSPPNWIEQSYTSVDKYYCGRGECRVRDFLGALNVAVRGDKDAGGFAVDRLVDMAAGIQLPFPVTAGYVRDMGWGVWVGTDLNLFGNQNKHIFCTVHPNAEVCQP